jgi:hypothetical protein
MNILVFIISSLLFFTCFTYMNNSYSKTSCRAYQLNKSLTKMTNKTVINILPTLYLKPCYSEISTKLELKGHVNNESKR